LILKENGVARLFASLTLIQFLNYIVPFVALPHILRALTPSGYGLFSFAFAFVAYFNIIIEYGFNISGVKEISKVKNNSNKISETVSNILFAKIFLFIAGTVLFLSIMFALKFANKNLLFAAYLFVVGSVFNPRWLLLALERLGSYVKITLLFRLLWLFCVFVFVRNRNSLLLLILLTSLAYILISTVSFFIALAKFKIKLLPVNLNSVKKELITGGKLFLSNFYIFLYTNSHVLILSLFANFKTVGLFSAANKIINGIKDLYWNFSQSIFPSVARNIESEFNNVILQIKKYLKVGLLAGGSIALVIVLFSGTITTLYFGREYADAQIILILLAFVPIIIFLSNIYGIQLMVALNYEKEFVAKTMKVMVIYLAVSFLLVPEFKAIGTALTILITESILTLNFRFFLKKKKIF